MIFFVGNIFPSRPENMHQQLAFWGKKNRGRLQFMVLHRHIYIDSGFLQLGFRGPTSLHGQPTSLFFSREIWIATLQVSQRDSWWRSLIPRTTRIMAICSPLIAWYRDFCNISSSVATYHARKSRSFDMYEFLPPFSRSFAVESEFVLVHHETSCDIL